MALLDDNLKSIFHLSDRSYSVSLSSTKLTFEPTNKKWNDASLSNSRKL